MGSTPLSGDSSLTRYLYTSREYDADTGLQYNRARWYDPATGRWISEDPIGFAAGDANLSRYVAGDVTNATDPSGLQEVPEKSTPQTSADVFAELLTKDHPYWIVVFSTNVAQGNGTELVRGHAWIGIVNNHANLDSEFAMPTAMAVGLHPIGGTTEVLRGGVPSRLAYEMETQFAIAGAYRVNSRQLRQALNMLRDHMKEQRDYHLADWNCSSLVIDIMETVVVAPGSYSEVPMSQTIPDDQDKFKNYSPSSLAANIEMTPPPLVFRNNSSSEPTTRTSP